MFIFVSGLAGTTPFPSFFLASASRRHLISLTIEPAQFPKQQGTLIDAEFAFFVFVSEPEESFDTCFRCVMRINTKRKAVPLLTNISTTHASYDMKNIYSITYHFLEITQINYTFKKT